MSNESPDTLALECRVHELSNVIFEFTRGRDVELAVAEIIRVKPVGH